MPAKSDRIQAGVVAFRLAGGRFPEVLLVARRSGRGWGLPKGAVPPDASPRRQALAEAWEEAGIEGALAAEPLGTVELSKKGALRPVHVYLMRVDRIASHYPEAAWRARRWVPAEAAHFLLAPRWHPVVSEARARLEGLVLDRLGPVGAHLWAQTRRSIPTRGRPHDNHDHGAHPTP